MRDVVNKKSRGEEIFNMAMRLSEEFVY